MDAVTMQGVGGGGSGDGGGGGGDGGSDGDNCGNGMYRSLCMVVMYAVVMQGEPSRYVGR